MKSPSIFRLLGATNNERGDLFTRLCRDLFFSLGYDNIQLDVATSGRELDIQGDHRHEPRRLLAECKAHSSPIGGGDVNKFLGVLTRERLKHAPKNVAGYFVSLGGFTGTCLQQENESGADGVILFDAETLVKELQRGRVVVGLNEAIERAGRCAQSNGIAGFDLDKSEIVGHATGYLWVIYFARNKELSHFALIHADGTPISKSLAEVVVDLDEANGGCLRNLSYLAPSFIPDGKEIKIEAFNQYKTWLGEECGYIQLDGLPADSDLSATKLKLEKLFVPLKAIYNRKSEIIKFSQSEFDQFKIEQLDIKSAIFEDSLEESSEELSEELSEESAEDPELDFTFDDEDSVEFSHSDPEFSFVTESIGSLISREFHLAILASPGGGKSTLIKRLATAYSFPDRRIEVADDLPDKDWLPLYLRCRDLRDRSYRPVLELLHGIAGFANMDDEHAKCFRLGVSEVLRSGQALLLVDGLDEISDEGARRAFAQNLRTFIAMFPNVALVVTSRVAGFRDVAGVIAGSCQQITLAPLDQIDVRRLCVSWHSEVVADTEKVRIEAAELADLIWNNEHIRSLVENPLLLTTLLVVKRSNGEIPPSRSELYSEAVRVLVRTWNVEGYAPLDERETLARLSYVACAMMQRGIQLIHNSSLIDLLNEAAVEMEPELQFARVSPSEFIRRIEYRSSLLMQTGYQRIEGELQPVFEFRHLTFQEYLAARGFVAEQYPGRNDDIPLVDILTPHIDDERWQEVIPLAAVLAGRKADSIIKRMILEYGGGSVVSGSKKRSRDLGIVSLLGRCLAEEVTLSPSVLRDALIEIALKLGGRRPSPILEMLLKGKFGKTLINVIEDGYYSNESTWTLFDSAFSETARVELGLNRQDLLNEELAKKMSENLVFGTRTQKVRAAYILMQMAYEGRADELKIAQVLRPHAKEFYDGFMEMLQSGDLPSAQAACWALAWFGTARVWSEVVSIEMMELLFRLWSRETASELVRKAAWAFHSQPLHPRDSIPPQVWGDCDSLLKSQLIDSEDNTRIFAVLLVGWYRRSPWSDDELIQLIKKYNIQRHNASVILAELLTKLEAVDNT